MIPNKKTDFSLGVQHRIFNNELRKRRIKLGLTQIQLGKMVGVGKSTINHYESFRQYPTTINVANKIAEVLKTTPSILFPEWLKVFKPKRTTIITEHSVTEPLLESSVPQYLLNDGNEQFEDLVEKKVYKDAIEKGLSTLTEREAKVISLRFGLESMPNNKDCTLENVGRIFGVSRNRIRQIEDKAIRKMKYSVGKKLGVKYKEKINPFSKNEWDRYKNEAIY